MCLTVLWETIWGGRNDICGSHWEYLKREKRVRGLWEVDGWIDKMGNAMEKGGGSGCVKQVSG